MSVDTFQNLLTPYLTAKLCFTAMFAGSSLIIFALLETELETELTLDVGDEPHADKRATTTKNKGKILNIYIGLLSIFKMAVPA